MHSHRPHLSLELLRSFEAAARHLNFTRAANEVFLTQSAISRAVKTLESQLGQPLFRRLPDGLELTEAGRALQQAAADALRTIDLAAAGLGVEAPTAQLTVTSNVPFASLWLAPRLPQFARSHPQIDLRVAASNEVIDLEREHVDIAVRWSAPGVAPGPGVRVAVERVFPVCAPALIQAPGAALATPADLSAHVWLQFEPDHMTPPWLDWTPWLEAMQAPQLAPLARLRFSHYDQVIQAALEGSGVALGRWPLVARHLVAGELVAPLGPAAEVEGGALTVLLSRGNRGRRVATDFVDWLVSEMALEDSARG
ncbi:MAG: LysR family transcriptional regulator [Burkholderiaceae bacterium]|nr:LysR family transcriptional regulator [Burkholderiaceae bacterium]